MLLIFAYAVLGCVIMFWAGMFIAMCSYVLDDTLANVIEREEQSRALVIVMGPHWTGGIESSVGVPALLSGAWTNQNLHLSAKIWPSLPPPHEPDEACLYHG